jgi:hypothetical protein
MLEVANVINDVWPTSFAGNIIAQEKNGLVATYRVHPECDAYVVFQFAFVLNWNDSKFLKIFYTLMTKITAEL